MSSSPARHTDTAGIDSHVVTSDLQSEQHENYNPLNPQDECPVQAPVSSSSSCERAIGASLAESDSADVPNSQLEGAVGSSAFESIPFIPLENTMDGSQIDSLTDGK